MNFFENFKTFFLNFKKFRGNFRGRKENVNKENFGVKLKKYFKL